MSKGYQVTRRKMRRPEQDFHKQLVKALQSVLTPETFFFHPANGGYRTPFEGKLFKTLGVIAGVPDLAVIYSGSAHFLELKAGKNDLTLEQRVAHDAIRNAGGRVETVRSIPEAFERLREWGIPLKTNDRFEIKDHIREETRRKRAA